MQQPKRFALIGLPGSGKSTFASKLGKLLDIPVHHLDRHMFVAGDKKRDREEFLSIQRALLSEDAWIIEGCSMSTLEMRFVRADVVVYFHFPRLLCMWRVFKRYLSPDKTLDDTPDGCSKIFNWEILTYIWNFDLDKRAGIEELQQKYPHAVFYELKNEKDLQFFLESMLKK